MRLKTRDIIVTTTSNLEGFRIIKYIETVSAHIVVGTNIFSDFLGSISDVFGGNSANYQGKLDSIYKQAIEKIKSLCIEKGGNGVVGLKIDIDEISGKGKSMFMITAVGTVVLKEQIISENQQIISENKNEQISVEELKELKTRKIIISKIKNETLKLNIENWNFILANKINEALPYLLKKYITLKQQKSSTDEEVIDFNFKLKTYINSLPKQETLDYLYSLINRYVISNSLIITKIMSELNLIDYKKTIDLIANEELPKQKLGLYIATFDKQYYDLNDIDNLKKLISIIESSFQEKGKITTKKQMLSSKHKEVWECNCGNTNAIDVKYCSSCQKDIYGFEIQELQPEKAILTLNEKIDLINELSN